MKGEAERKSRYWRIAAAGIFFQGGAAAVDTGTIVAALVNGLTGSTVAVGAAAAISRYGWLFPQLFVAYFAQRKRRRLPYYMLGAFGRVLSLSAVVLLLMASTPLPGSLVIGGFFLLWTLYAFVSGIVAVPYNDIVARSVPSRARSGLLAVRFFGGGLLALGVALMARSLLAGLPFPAGHAAVLATSAAMLLVSTLLFVSAGEPDAPPPPAEPSGFAHFMRAGFKIFAHDDRFRLFVYARWLDGAAAMALPFYVVQASRAGVSLPDVAVLLGAQTAGALASNPLWGWWGDRIGKRSLLHGTASVTVLAPVLALAWIVTGGLGDAPALHWFSGVFFILGAVGNGGTIAQLGYLMEISPDDRRPAYSGYFNAVVAPAALAPLVGGLLATTGGLAIVFAASSAAALFQVFVVRRLREVGEPGDRG